MPPEETQNNPTDLGSEPPAPAQPQQPTSEQTPPNSDPASGTDLGAENSPEPSNEPKDGSTDLGSEDPNAPKPYAEYVGPPETGAYEDFTLPDGMPADEELKSEFIPFAQELGLSQKGAQKAVDFYAKVKQKELERWSGHVKSLREEARADPEIGGANYDKAVAAGRSLISKYGTPGLRQVLNAYGVGAHKEMIRFMGKIAAAFGETSTLTSGEGGGGTGKAVPLHELMYKD